MFEEHEADFSVSYHCCFTGKEAWLYKPGQQLIQGGAGTGRSEPQSPDSQIQAILSQTDSALATCGGKQPH